MFDKATTVAGDNIFAPSLESVASIDRIGLVVCDQFRTIGNTMRKPNRAAMADFAPRVASALAVRVDG